LGEGESAAAIGVPGDDRGRKMKKRSRKEDEEEG